MPNEVGLGDRGKQNKTKQNKNDSHIFYILGIFFNLPKSCKISVFLTKILKFVQKNVENKSKYFPPKLCK